MGTGYIVEAVRAKGKTWRERVFPAGKGGAGDTFGWYYLYRSGKAPVALLCNRPQNTTLAGALLTDTPMLYAFEEEVEKVIKTGDRVRVDSDKGTVEVL